MKVFVAVTGAALFAGVALAQVSPSQTDDQQSARPCPPTDPTDARANPKGGTGSAPLPCPTTSPTPDTMPENGMMPDNRTMPDNSQVPDNSMTPMNGAAPQPKR